MEKRNALLTFNIAACQALVIEGSFSMVYFTNFPRNTFSPLTTLANYVQLTQT
jgi:hypothetical protein